MNSPSKCACLSPASRIRIAADIHRYSTSDDDSGCVMDEYAWIPNGVKPDTIHTYFAALPQNKVPFVNSAGEQWRLEQLVKQLPAQDSDPRYCGKLSPNEESELNAFEKERKKQFLGRGLIQQLPIYADNRKLYCHQCKSAINSEDLVISAPERFEDSVFWHPGCFVCVECKELLVDLIFFKHNQNVFCGRHHAEQIKPRCSACDELVFSEECTEAEGRVWHMRHFECQACKIQLGGQRYILRNKAPYCLPCYHQAAQFSCNTCLKEIVADKPHITQGDIHWHASEDCFCCSSCKKNLLGKCYSFLNNHLYCGYNTCSKTIIPKRTISLSTATALSLALEPDLLKPIKTLSPWKPICKSKSHSSKVRFDLSRHQPPMRSPPPIPQNSQSNPQENIYETVVVPSTSNSPILQQPHNFVQTMETNQLFNLTFGQTDQQKSVRADEGHHFLIATSKRRSRAHRKETSNSCTNCGDGECGCSSNSSCFSGLDQELQWRLEMEKKKPQRSRSADGKGGKRHRSRGGRRVLEEGKKNDIVEVSKQQNFYSKMPPNEKVVERRSNRAYSSYSSSSSDSEADAEDAYLSHYLAIAASLPMFNKLGVNQQPLEKEGRRQPAKLITPRTAKNKANSSSSHCIVS